jgi:hypothetical protein
MTTMDGIIEALREQRKRIDNAVSALQSTWVESASGRKRAKLESAMEDPTGIAGNSQQ